jgi:transcription antitermination factor NusG
MYLQVPVESVQQRSDHDWHVLYARHQHEKMVAQILSSKGFEVFLPLYSAVHRWKDRNKQLWLPLFPCYVFFQGGLERQLDMLTTPGVYSVICGAGRPAVIPGKEIDAVRQMIAGSGSVEPHPFLKIGDWVRVKAGSLAGLEGILVRKKNQFRLVVSVEMLGRSASTEVDASMVERVSPRTVAAPPSWAPGHVRTQQSLKHSIS